MLASDLELQSAIRHQLREHRATEPTRGPSASSVVASLKLKERKLLDLYYADKIDADGFAVEQQRLKIQITTLESEIDHVERERSSLDRAACLLYTSQLGMKTRTGAEPCVLISLAQRNR